MLDFGISSLISAEAIFVEVDGLIKECGGWDEEGGGEK